MRNIVLLLLVFCSLSCTNQRKSVELKKNTLFSKVEIETLIQDSLLNVRALEVNYGEIVAATSKGDFYQLFDDGKTFGKMNYDEVGNDLDSIGENNFRSLAIVKYPKLKHFYPQLGLTVGSPAKLYKQGKLVYQENHSKAFYDSMEFWNDKEGIAMGDPTDDCISIIITRDGGDSWTKLSCNDLPKAIEGEAAFAASDTNIAIVGDETWIATGGMASRILYSPNKGKTWEIFDTPIIQGKPTTGMYSIDFYDSKNGFAIGGDYTDADGNIGNKIRTNDGGKTWQLVADGENPGYRSCVQYIPGSNATELVAVGFKGIDYSNNNGETWKHLSDEGFYTIRFLNDSIAYAAGKGRISKLSFR